MKYSRVTIIASGVVVALLGMVIYEAGAEGIGILWMICGVALQTNAP